MTASDAATLDPLAGWPVWQREDRPFLERALRRVPARFVPALRRRYTARLQPRAGESRFDAHREANAMVGHVRDTLADAGRRLDYDDDQLRASARAYAERCRWAVRGLPPAPAAGRVAIRAGRAGLPEPGGDHHPAQVARGCDDQWWRRQLRRQTARDVERAARELGLVCRHGQTYASDETVARRRQQRTRNRQLLEEVQAVNEAGQTYTLAELADLSQANPKLRRGELMVRIRGTEELADAADHVGVFLTLTCPSRFHAVHHRGEQNARWDGSDPRDGQLYLRTVWANARAALHRENVQPYGVRVAEPHHDGTPHWHLLLFAPEADAERVVAVLQDYALRDSPDEPGAQTRRLDVEWIDKDQGTATGYIAKYVAKAVDGGGLDGDLFGNDAGEAAARIDAWASAWGIRQFQFVGTPPVGLWREVRRLDGAPQGALGQAYAAADAGNWRRFAEVVAEAPELAVAKDSGGENRYGEAAADRPVGVQDADGTIYRTRKRVWATGRAGEVRRPPYSTARPPIDGGRAWAGQLARLYERRAWGGSMAALWSAMHYNAGGTGDGSLGNSGLGGLRGAQVGLPLENAGGGRRRVRPGVGLFLGGREAAAPWTRVNNCTEGAADGSGRPVDPPGYRGAIKGGPRRHAQYRRPG